MSVEFSEVGRLPAPGDNVAIAGRRLAAGTQIQYQADSFRLSFALLEGHRFAVRSIAPGELLLSWGLPFGVAIHPIEPGDYACNEAMLEALRGRQIDFEIPQEPNFRDQIQPYRLLTSDFRPGKQVTPHASSRSFQGYYRGPARGAGTRNMILILGTTSRSASYARLLEARLQGTAAALDQVDGVVAISHSEGSGGDPLNNRDLLLRTLAGWMVHANVGAVLAVDAGQDQIDNQGLRQYMLDHDYPLNQVRHHFMSLSGALQADLDQGEALIREWLAEVNQTQRTSQPLSHLKVALQCGGSDAFSGVSGNPLAAAVAREIIRYGGSANLAETDELIGAEAYLLQNVRDLATAQTFLQMIARFKERLAWHGATAEGNPSGGNRYRGLYNIVLKSIGAAMKRDPQVRLDYAVEYGQPMQRPGFYFMDTPGNDLESIAGQVGGGSNLILFVTGNGSITNFPLVPTLKIMTTSSRFALLAADMDINAGAYQDGVPMDELTRQALDLVVAVASGQRSSGERAGHAQVSIWRNWRQRDGSQLDQLIDQPAPGGQPLPIQAGDILEMPFHFKGIQSATGAVTDQVGLIMPTSLCAGQIARMAAARLNQIGLGQPEPISRFVSLTHTEGCGVAIQASRNDYDRLMISYMTHPLVKFALFLEHGCEKTHNDHMRHLLRKLGRDPAAFGWASVQLDGGIDQVLQKIEGWFRKVLADAPRPVYQQSELSQLRLGLLSAGKVPAAAAQALAKISRTVVAAGGLVVIPRSDALLADPAFRVNTLASSPDTTLAYGQQAAAPGFHVMEQPSTHGVETLTGLAAAGVELMLAHVDGIPRQGHPLVPLLQIHSPAAGSSHSTSDFDLVLQGDSQGWAEAILEKLMQVASRAYTPRLLALGNVDFQISRGLLGIST